LKRLGVNPAGNDVLYQDFKYEGDFHHWTTFFNFDDDSKSWRAGLSDEAEQAKNSKLRRKVISEICSVLFNRSYFGFESAGLGYAQIDLRQDQWEILASEAGVADTAFREICAGVLRILGDLFRYPQEPEKYKLDS